MISYFFEQHRGFTTTATTLKSLDRSSIKLEELALKPW